MGMHSHCNEAVTASVVGDGLFGERGSNQRDYRARHNGSISAGVKYIDGTFDTAAFDIFRSHLRAEGSSSRTNQNHGANRLHWQFTSATNHVSPPSSCMVSTRTDGI